MAKKKSSKKKKATRRQVSAKKKTKAAKPAKSRGATARKSTSTTSVDGVLKKFSRERVALESELASLRKKIEDTTSKIRSLEDQVAKLTEKELATEQSIEQLDSRRDTEVSEMLAKMGVKLKTPSSAQSSSSSPFSVLMSDESTSASSEPA